MILRTALQPLPFRNNNETQSIQKELDLYKCDLKLI